MRQPYSGAMANYPRYAIYFTAAQGSALNQFGSALLGYDAYGGDDPEANYINFRFKGGGGNFANRLQRVHLIERLLTWAGFTVATRGDLLDAGFQRRPLAEILGRLTLLGILQGKCRLLDMSLGEDAELDEMVASFQTVLHEYIGADKERTER